MLDIKNRNDLFCSKKDHFFNVINLNRFHEKCSSADQIVFPTNSNEFFDDSVLLIYKIFTEQLRQLKTSQYFSFINFDNEVSVQLSCCILQLFMIVLIIYALAKYLSLYIVKRSDIKRDCSNIDTGVKVFKKHESNLIKTSTFDKCNIKNAHETSRKSGWDSHSIEDGSDDLENEIWKRKNNSVIQNKIDNRKRQKLIKSKRKCNSAGPILTKLSDKDDELSDTCSDKDLNENTERQSLANVYAVEKEKEKYEKNNEQTITITSYYYLCVFHLTAANFTIFNISSFSL